MATALKLFMRWVEGEAERLRHAMKRMSREAERPEQDAKGRVA